jgi:hypothetical protein
VTLAHGPSVSNRHTSTPMLRLPTAEVLSDGRERSGEELRLRNVAESHDVDLAGDSHSLFHEGPQHAQRHRSSASCRSAGPLTTPSLREFLVTSARATRLRR